MNSLEPNGYVWLLSHPVFINCILSQKRKKDGKERAPFEEDTAPSDPGEPAPEAQETQEMSSEEAAMLLEGFRQEENAQGHLQYMREGQLRAPEKDW